MNEQDDVRKYLQPIIIKDGEQKCYICQRTVEEFKHWLDSNIKNEKTRSLIWNETGIGGTITAFQFFELELMFTRADGKDMCAGERGEWKSRGRLGKKTISIQIHICPVCRKIFEARRIFGHSTTHITDGEHGPFYVYDRVKR